MQTITTIGLDIAKSVFQVHGVDAAGQVVIRRQLKRHDPSDKRVPEVARACLAALGNQLLSLKAQIVEFDRMIMIWHRSNETSKRLHYIPGVRS